MEDRWPSARYRLDARFMVTRSADGGTSVVLAPPGSGSAAAGGGKSGKGASGGKGGGGGKGKGGKKGGKGAKKEGTGGGKDGAPAAPPADPLAEPPNTSRRDWLVSLESKWQTRWDEAKIYEADAPEATGEDDSKFFVTFPYPYMNGRLHVGHAYTMAKAEVAARFHRLRGDKVLFPFAFHCTGMPIQAAANKLARQLAEEGKAEEEGGSGKSGESRESGAASGGGSGEKADVTKFTSSRSKAVAKTGTGVTQADILRMSGVEESKIPSFTDPVTWLRHFPPQGKTDLHGLGLAVDWRRSFITTDVNPYYDAFIRWQFRRLRAAGKIKYGTRPTIYSPLDGQACADHDRSVGEGVAVQEYTLIKILVARDDSGALPAKLAQIDEAAGNGADGNKRNVYLVAATLRPETMYGQTNCFVLPDGEYGVYEVADGGDLFVCSHRSARNMAFQGLSPKHGEVRLIATVTGRDLLGSPLRAPNATFPIVYTLPLLTISMDKGTGVVTSVPSDAPDDYAALMDLKNKPALREKFGIEEYMVEPFDVVEIIEIPDLGRRAAVRLCEEMGIKSQNDRDKLKEAKDLVYTKGFYNGRMLCGTFAGELVQNAKTLVRDEMIAAGTACMYHEPDGKVVSRSGDECVVAPLEQWYLNYGEEEWRKAVEAHVESEHFSTFTASKANYLQALAWLREWGCSRDFGLGTRLPADEKYVIESLSDSTIYMAYYTIAHLLQGGVFDGSEVGPAGIRPEQLNDEVFDAIFIADDAPAGDVNGIPKATIERLRREFNFWYPLDLRVSGKDLINNHLTMSLYNHAAIWPDRSADRMPRGFFTNGHVLVNHEKMSKSKGNFITLSDGVRRFSADGLRFALADAGDNLEDANFETDKADRAIVSLFREMVNFREFMVVLNGGDESSVACTTIPADSRVREEFKLRPADAEFTMADRIFQAGMDEAITKAAEGYEAMRNRDAIQWGFHNLFSARDLYRDICNRIGLPLHPVLMKRFANVACVTIAPICPHWAEEVYEVIGRPGGYPTVTAAPWPSTSSEEAALADAGRWLEQVLHACRDAAKSARRVAEKKKGKGTAPSGPIDTIRIYAVSDFTPWQKTVLDAIREMWTDESGGAGDGAASGGGGGSGRGKGALPSDAMGRIAKLVGKDPELRKSKKDVMKFAGSVINVGVPEKGYAAIDGKPPFNDHAFLNTLTDYVQKSLEEYGLKSVEVIFPEEAVGSETARARTAVPGAPTPVASSSADAE